MDKALSVVQIIFYPLGYFLALAAVYVISKFTTMFLVAAGRLKSFHAVSNYWIYILIALFCALIGVIVSLGDYMVFCRWFACTTFVGLLGIHFGFEKGVSISDEDLQEIANSADEMRKSS
ncbi:hypothetical protein [Mucilaginibacter ginkgonis]|uniref:Uncharacterized protein n=1 Tax=Mucilaginibacter ginkgonis TaxID=2682091 RepID=A0A6I4HWW8_9SPHI|nr:hypothetical protein [Mucilaginibacter ginkgonis]QQL49904.1 hypothetical protein GO620_000185 [Mucilaginibacter ginkgonis]